MSDPDDSWQARQHPEARHHSYLGDGVYACHDGWHVWLMTLRDDGPRQVVHEIALEPSLLRNLSEYVAAVNATEMREQITREKDIDRIR